MRKTDDSEEQEAGLSLSISPEVDQALQEIEDLVRRNDLRCGIEKMLDHYNSCGKISQGRDWLSRQPAELRGEAGRLNREKRARRLSVVAGSIFGSAATTFFNQ